VTTITKIEKNLFAVEGVILFSDKGSEIVSRGFRTLGKATEYANGLDRNNARVTEARAERRIARLNAAYAYLAVRAARKAEGADQLNLF
jgi:hypothetical protein